MLKRSRPLFYININLKPMKYSESLLKKFISINDDIQNIADKFTLKTVEVEEIIERKMDFESSKENFLSREDIFGDK